MGLINSTIIVDTFNLMTIEQLEELKKHNLCVYFYDNNNYYFNEEGELINRLIESER